MAYNIWYGCRSTEQGSDLGTFHSFYVLLLNVSKTMKRTLPQNEYFLKSLYWATIRGKNGDFHLSRDDLF